MQLKTKVNFVDELNEPSDITFDKWIADALIAKVGDLHNWVQSIYDRIVTGNMIEAKGVIALRRKTGKLHRRKIGDFIRNYALTMVADTCEDF